MTKKMTLKERYEEACFRALKADCGFMVNVNAETAMGWLVKMINTYGIN